MAEGGERGKNTRFQIKAAHLCQVNAGPTEENPSHLSKLYFVKYGTNPVAFVLSLYRDVVAVI
jgi:hypothetical protein